MSSLSILQQQLEDYQKGQQRYQRAADAFKSTTVMDGDRPMLVYNGDDGYSKVNFGADGNGTVGSSYSIQPGQEVEHYGGSNPNLYYVRTGGVFVGDPAIGINRLVTGGVPLVDPAVDINRLVPGARGTQQYDFSNLPAKPTPDMMPKDPGFTMAQARQLKDGTPDESTQMIQQEMMTDSDKQDQMGVLQKVLSKKM
jgi:hypothetical protein